MNLNTFLTGLAGIGNAAINATPEIEEIIKGAIGLIHPSVDQPRALAAYEALKADNDKGHAHIQAVLRNQFPPN